MNLFNYFKKPIVLFTIGMLLILLAVFLKPLNTPYVLKTPLFIIGLTIEGMAIAVFVRTKMFSK